MNDYSIELSAARIIDTRTKRYFSEVFACYSAGHYRSAVVMLWSVVVTDMLFKVDQLANADGDAAAKAILQKMASYKEKEPKSSGWELELITDACNDLALIDPAALISLTHLQSHRHLSAHPIITSDETLFSPSREVARAHIRTALDEVLTRPAIMSRRVFDRFMIDIEALSNLHIGPGELKQFLESKYLRYFGNSTLSSIFKSLWRITFRCEDQRARDNREANCKALRVVFERKTESLTEIVKSEAAWFSDVSNSFECIDASIQFFQAFPHVFPLLTDAIKIPIYAVAKQDLDQFVQCWFMHPRHEDVVHELEARMEGGETLRSETLGQFLESIRTSDAIDQALFVGIKSYMKSGNFNMADKRFLNIIAPFVSLYQKKHFEAFLAGCENCYNKQATLRSAAPHDHGDILKALIERFPEIDIARYPAFKSSLTT
jgi:hypothetical protein